MRLNVRMCALVILATLVLLFLVYGFDPGAWVR
jgi:hypothetical protein